MNRSISIADVLDALPEAIYVTDANGRLTHFNAAAVDLAGRVPELGNDRWCISWKMYHTDGRPMPPEDCPMSIAIREGRAVRGAEIIIEQPNGKRFHVLPYPTPLLDQRGCVIGGINMLVDVTHRKAAEETQARLAAIVEASDDAIISKSLDGTIRTWNRGAQRIFGYTEEEAIGRHISLIIPDELLHEEQLILRRIGKGERVDHIETIRVAKDGRRIDISLTVSPIRDSTGWIIGASKVARDITDRKRAEAAKKVEERRKDEFLATLAHELRNPLAPLNAAVEILRRAVDAEQRQAVQEIIERQVNRMNRLVDDLLDRSRVSQGKLRLDTRRLDLRDVLRCSIEDAQQALTRANHALNVVLPSDPIVVEGDSVRLEQVFSNLLSNATKYTPEGGRIELVAVAADGGVTVTVSDNGVGMPPESLEAIFGMFSQLDHTLSNVQGGLGIGLSLVKALVSMHGGRVSAHSVGLGKGSTVVVWLPTRDDGVLVTSVDDLKRRTPDNVSTPRRRILIADDNRDAAQALSAVVELLGHEARVAFDGIEAVKAAAEFVPELVLLDIGMPRLDGYEVARQIRAHDWGRFTVIAALTGWDQASLGGRSCEAGFDRYFTKPLRFETLKEVIAGLRSIPQDSGGQAGKSQPPGDCQRLAASEDKRPAAKPCVDRQH